MPDCVRWKTILFTRVFADCFRIDSTICHSHLPIFRNNTIVTVSIATTLPSSPLLGYRKYGTPTIRSDLPAPTIKRVSDTTSYGDESDAHGLMNPSIFNQHGVNERDFLGPRSKNEVSF